MNSFFFSIITVTYNAEQCIDKTLLSIMRQSFQNYELIIIDGCSTDGTLAKITSASSKIQNVQIISESDNGIYDAMNKGLKLVRGSFVFFLNAGDSFFNDDVLFSIHKKILRFDAVYYGDAIGINHEGVHLPYRMGSFSKYRLGYSNICHQTIFYPSNSICNESFDLKYKVLADWDLNMRLFKKVKFVYMKEIVSFYDLDGISSLMPDKQFCIDQKVKILKYLGLDVLCYLIFRKIFRLIRCVKS